MPIDIDNMRSEFNFRSANTELGQDAAPAAIDNEQLRELIRELVMEIVNDDLYSLFRTRGM